MNTGIQDGHNLAWKIAAVLDGSFTPALLDTYETARRRPGVPGPLTGNAPGLPVAGRRPERSVRQDRRRLPVPAPVGALRRSRQDLHCGPGRLTLDPVHRPGRPPVASRPDGFVAWRGATEESLREALRDLGRGLR
ncbi:FAD-dependent monooxygenase [Actinoallomurus sp. CA-142502]|uniref:FAD-dependent monooxygenase n=1 Tax=Actinoallomurus sp. CA-142502 TaxID=3239885 RepID=UPI003D8E4314